MGFKARIYKEGHCTMSHTQEGQSLGIDLSKEWISAELFPSGQTWTADRTQDALREWIKELPHGIILAVMEASGGYEALPAALLHEAGIPVAVVNPRQIRGFAVAMNLKAKTDEIDAGLIARFAHTIHPTPKPMSSPEQERLKELLRRRGQLMKMLTGEKNRLGMAGDPRVRNSIETHLEWMTRELSNIDKELTSLIQASPLWKAKEDFLKSVPGVGTITARSILAGIPELGSLNRKEAASLAGLAPFTHQSGKWQGHSFITGGRPGVRRSLYMATLCAIRFNPDISTFYARLIQSGKPKKVAIIACMRKLLTILNALMREERFWQISSFSA
jgi:transposase